MRTIVISDRSRLALEGAIAGCAFKLERQLADKSWEATIDDDLAFAMDLVGPDPDAAIQFICSDETRGSAQSRAVF